FEKFGPVERVERSRIQKISGPGLARNWVMIPHVTHNDEADITELEAWRKQLNKEYERDEVKVTMVAFLIKASVASLKEFPIVNAPELAILGVTRSAIKPVWDGSEFVPRLMVPLSLSYDHRVIDGAAAARFMVYLVKVLSDLRRALL